MGQAASRGVTGELMRLQVLCGSPCGSTAAASAEIVGQYLSPEMLRHFGLRICHHCRAPRPGRTCDKETAGLIHLREPLRALPPGSAHAETAAFSAECGQVYDRRKGRLDDCDVRPDSLSTTTEAHHG